MKETATTQPQQRRTYQKQELALLYFPGSQPQTAVKHLMAWIRQCRPLARELEGMHYSGSQKYFTPRQADAIMRYLGEP